MDSLLTIYILPRGAARSEEEKQKRKELKRVEKGGREKAEGERCVRKAVTLVLTAVIAMLTVVTVLEVSDSSSSSSSSSNSSGCNSSKGSTYLK